MAPRSSRIQKSIKEREILFNSTQMTRCGFINLPLASLDPGSNFPTLIGLLELHLGQTGEVGLIGYKLHYFKRGGGVNISQLSMIQLKMINYKSTTELFLFPPNYSHIFSGVESFTEQIRAMPSSNMVTE